MTQGPSGTAEDQQAVSLSDSDDIVAAAADAPSHPQSLASPSHTSRKHNLIAPHSPTSKRPRIQTQSPSQQPLQPTSPSAPNKPATKHVDAKPGDASSPSARRRSPTAKGKHTEPNSESNQPESDEEDAPLDLATISSYEYEQVAKLNPVQLRRYEQYRRSDLKNAKVRKLILAINPISKPTDPYIIAVKGLAKLFVGDIVETALQVKKSLGHKGALQPSHIREAYRRLRRDGAVPSSNQNDSVLQ